MAKDGIKMFASPHYIRTRLGMQGLHNTSVAEHGSLLSGAETSNVAKQELGIPQTKHSTRQVHNLSILPFSLQRSTMKAESNGN